MADVFDDTPTAGDNSGAVNVGQLRSFVERFERVQEEIDGLKEDQKEIKAEAKSNGYDMKAFAEMVKLRKLDLEERKERETIRDLYAGALGVFG